MSRHQNQCSICHDDLKEDVCIVNCAAVHAFHYQCIQSGILNGKKECPLDRQNITKCIHDGQVKILPDSPIKQPQVTMLVQYQQTPCYICHCNTRGDREFDEIVVCSGCEIIFCHAQCQERQTSRVFDYGVMWFCPPCQAERLRARRPATRSTLRNI